MITEERLDKVIKEARRFLEFAKLAKNRLKHDPCAIYGSKETAQVRRASLDLTRELSRLRSRDE